MRKFARMAAGIMLVILSLGFVSSDLVPGLPAAYAQNLGQRVVAGNVVDATGTSPVVGVTVFLRNTKTKAIRSYTTDKEGRFRFAQVNMAEDYDLWAEINGQKSPVKSVSSWDTRKEFNTELRLK